ncbi:DNA-J related domain-containing protein [Marinomonas sp. THO17]|uniref:DNA-J related domain-containing protein n=1 Tax=Marinomonas sp. THO17 TaxID=3149048 RepID=UPI00336BCF51
MKNPLIAPILSMLKARPHGLKEFDILKSLQAQFPEFSQLADDTNLQLFRQHFLIMNALYQLQSRLWQEDNLMLSIEATHIRLLTTQHTTTSDNTNLNNSAEAKLAAYYLDWNEYEKTDETDVARLLKSFYKGICHPGDRRTALKTLKLAEDNPSKNSIKQQYRKLAQQYHPDRGGDQETFISLREAYEQLMLQAQS